MVANDSTLQLRESILKILADVENFDKPNIDFGGHKCEFPVSDILNRIMLWGRSCVLLVSEDRLNDAAKFAPCDYKGIIKALCIEDRLVTYDTCSECGEHFEIKFDGERLFTNSKCPVPGGLKPWTLELEIPSGKLVFRNDMRDLFPTSKGFYVNRTCGIKECEEHYASLGMFHVFVGNSCPSVYTFPDGRVIVGRLFDEDEPESKPKEYAQAEKVGFICTDLWWFSACDYDDFVRRNGKEPNDEWPPDITVQLKPGKYKLTSYYSTSNNTDKLKEYAVIEMSTT